MWQESLSLFVLLQIKRLRNFNATFLIAQASHQVGAVAVAFATIIDVPRAAMTAVTTFPLETLIFIFARRPYVAVGANAERG